MQTENTRQVHFLGAHYLTHQPDGFHAEARCTCGIKLEGLGKDEKSAVDSLRRAYTEYLQKPENLFMVA